MTSTYQTTMDDTSYNGWTNYATWNVALWMGNDEFLYNTAIACVRYCEVNDTPYDAFVRSMNNCGAKTTGDGVKWNDPNINAVEMNEIMEEL